MIIPVGFGQVNWIFDGQVGDDGAEVTLGFENVAAMSAQDCADGWRNILNASDINDAWTDQVTLRKVLVKLGPNATGPSAESAVNATGTSNQATSPPNVALLVHKGTPLGGRAGRGRMYLPGCPETVIDGDGDVDGTFRTAIQTELDQLLVAAIAADLDPRLLHGAGSPIATPTQIDLFTLDAKCATQRRRLRR